MRVLEGGGGSESDVSIVRDDSCIQQCVLLMVGCAAVVDCDARRHCCGLGLPIQSNGSVVTPESSNVLL